jgi:centromere-localized protein 2
MIFTLAQFRKLFPRQTRKSPAIKALYAELAHQVSLGVDDVKRNIAAEVRRGVVLRRKVRGAKRRMQRRRWAIGEEMAEDVRMDGQVCFSYSRMSKRVLTSWVAIR